jgi:hypothetical protein
MADRAATGIQYLEWQGTVLFRPNHLGEYCTRLCVRSRKLTTALRRAHHRVLVWIRSATLARSSTSRADVLPIVAQLSPTMRALSLCSSYHNGRDGSCAASAKLLLLLEPCLRACAVRLVRLNLGALAIVERTCRCLAAPLASVLRRENDGCA